MEAIILCGGLGTRLRTEVPDLPKPMAPIDSRPFLDYLLEYLDLQGFTRVILSVGYLHEKISEYFGRSSRGIEIEYVIEDEPKGTGGAIKLAITAARNNEIFVLNGDTFVGLDYSSMLDKFMESESQIMMALRPVDDVSRYGKVVIEGSTVSTFEEKGSEGPGLINAGVYLLKRKLLSQYKLQDKFSFETDFLSVYLKQLQPASIIADNYFIDIGIPDSYRTAQAELAAAIEAIV